MEKTPNDYIQLADPPLVLVREQESWAVLQDIDELLSAFGIEPIEYEGDRAYEPFETWWCERFDKENVGCSWSDLAPFPYRPKVRKKLPFRAWLLLRARTPDNVGDVARDMVRDPTLPQTDSPQELARHMQTLPRCSSDAVRCLARAWLAYHTGFKEFPQTWDPVRLLKAYAMIDGIWRNPTYKTFYGRAQKLGVAVRMLKLVLRDLEVPLPEPYRWRLVRARDGYLPIEQHRELGRSLMEAEALVRDMHQDYFWPMLLANDPVCRRLRRCERAILSARSSMEDWIRRDEFATDVYFGYDKVDPGISVLDRLILDSSDSD